MTINYKELEEVYEKAKVGDAEPNLVIRAEDIRKCITCDEPAATWVHPDNVLCTSCSDYIEQ
jgi:hypothetical protein